MMRCDGCLAFFVGLPVLLGIFLPTSRGDRWNDGLRRFPTTVANRPEISVRVTASRWSKNSVIRFQWPVMCSTSRSALHSDQPETLSSFDCPLTEKLDVLGDSGSVGEVIMGAEDQLWHEVGGSWSMIETAYMGHLICFATTISEMPPKFLECRRSLEITSGGCP